MNKPLHTTSSFVSLLLQNPILELPALFKLNAICWHICNLILYKILSKFLLILSFILNFKRIARNELFLQNPQSFLILLPTFLFLLLQKSDPAFISPISSFCIISFSELSTLLKHLL